MRFWLLLLAVLTAGVAAKPVNPFARPTLEHATPVNAEVSAVNVRPVLRGIILAGADSIVNLNGMPLAIGESLAGYELVSVDETSATFLLGENAVTLHLEDEDPEDDE